MPNQPPLLRLNVATSRGKLLVVVNHSELTDGDDIASPCSMMGAGPGGSSAGAMALLALSGAW